MKAGSELDGLVAETVMKWKREKLHDGYWYWLHSGKDFWSPIERFRPSTSIDDAWPIWLKELEKNPWWRLGLSHGADGYQSHPSVFDGSEYQDTIVASAETFEVVICLAALKSAGVEIPDA